MLREEVVLILDANELQDCIVCCEPTLNIVKCCRAPICKVCYIEWLKQKRQCLHCKADQCTFQIWIDNYHTEPLFNPQEYLHDLINDMHNSPETQTVPNFTVEDLLNFIQQHLGTQNNPHIIYMEDPTNIFESGELFDIEYGFTISPTDGNSHPITVSHRAEYENTQMHAVMQQYQELFNQYQMQ